MNPKALLALILAGAAVTGIVAGTKKPKKPSPKPPAPKPAPPPGTPLPPPPTPMPPPPAPSMADDARLVSFAIPDKVKKGERVRLRIALRNAGTATWDGSYRLGVVGDLAGDAARFLEAAGVEPNRVHLPAGRTVAPGTEHAFEFDVVGPAAPRVYTLRFQMVHEGVGWFGPIVEKAVTLEAPPLPPRATARRGKVRASGRCLRDDDGDFQALGTSLFWAAWAYKNDRPKLERALDALSRAGFDYVRALGVVGDPNRPDYWDGREISMRDPDYKATIAGLTDLAYDTYGLRLEWTLIGDGQVTVPTSAERYLLADWFLEMSRGREHKIIHFETANEAWQNGFPGPNGLAELRALTKYLNDRTDVLVAASAPDGHEPQDHQRVYAGGIADVGTIHFDRDVGKTEGHWRPVRQPWEYVYVPDLPALGSNNEPIGPGASVAADDDPTRLVSGAIVTWISALPLHVYHTRAGIRGLPADGEIADQPGLMAFAVARRLLPNDLPNWSRKNAHWVDAPFRVYARDQAGRAYVDTMWPDLGGGATGTVRSYGAVRGNEFVVYPMGIQGSVLVEARRAMSFEVFEPLTGASLGRKDLAAGEQTELRGATALIVRGTYR